ncbi:MAG: SDR family oxidoreductase [Gemmatimonadota bacterium]|nr:SDR family oxidoreductase [Gemmatimonadota bacterium]
MRAVLITGASQGIGEAIALRLDGLGFHVFAGVRSDAAGQALRRKGSPSLTPLQLDVTEPQSIASTVATVESRGPYEFVGLVNNAAVSTPGPLEFMPLDDVREQLDVNLFGPLAVTQAILPLIRQAGAGRIVNISSINGKLAQRYIGAYSASKFALEGLSDALRQELRPWGIRVVVVEPGAIETLIFQTSRQRGRALAQRLPPQARELYGDVINALLHRPGRTPRHALPPHFVARRVAHALTARRPRARYAVGWDVRVALLLQRILPSSLLDWLLAR